MAASVWLQAARGPVSQYLASRPQETFSRWERWYPTFTTGYFRFHAQRAGVRPWPYQWATYLFLAVFVIAGIAGLAKA